MKLHYPILYILIFALFSAFKINQACDYADSNLGYVKAEIEKAMAMDDLQLVRYHTYKALNAISKSKKQLEECGCADATANITEGSEHLKQATKATSLASSGILLKKALEETTESLEALKNHQQHDSPYGNDVLVMNTDSPKNKVASHAPPSDKVIRQKIDSSLIKYRISLGQVINTIDCEKAHDFAQRIYNDCEQQLLKPNLSEGKKYYNLKTKEITAEALKKLGDCK